MEKPMCKYVPYEMERRWDGNDVEYERLDPSSDMECSLCGYALLSDWFDPTDGTPRFNYCPSCGCEVDYDRDDFGWRRCD